MQCVRCAQPFDRRNFGTVGLPGSNLTRPNSLTIDMHCARPALRNSAAVFHSGYLQFISENPKQWHVIFNIRLAFFSIYDELHGDLLVELELDFWTFLVNMSKIELKRKSEIEQDMNERKRQILEAAWRVFSRYGLSKSTMNDIAREASVARQTLYNAYDGKDEVFRAVVRMGASETLKAVELEWDRLESLADKIDAFYRLGPISWYDIIEQSPDAAGLIEGFSGIAAKDLQDVAAEWVDMIALRMAPFEAKMAKKGMKPREVADFLYSGAKAAKYDTQSRDVFLKRLSVLKASVLALSGE